MMEPMGEQTTGTGQPAGDTREAILDAAERFLEHGRVRDLTVTRLMEPIPVSREAFYKHFPSRYAVIAALLGRFTHEVAAGFTCGTSPPRSGGSTPLSRLARPDARAHTPHDRDLERGRRGIVEWRGADRPTALTPATTPLHPHGPHPTRRHGEVWTSHGTPNHPTDHRARHQLHA